MDLVLTASCFWQRAARPGEAVAKVLPHAAAGAPCMAVGRAVMKVMMMCLWRSVALPALLQGGKGSNARDSPLQRQAHPSPQGHGQLRSAIVFVTLSEPEAAVGCRPADLRIACSY